MEMTIKEKEKWEDLDRYLERFFRVVNIGTRLDSFVYLINEYWAGNRSDFPVVFTMLKPSIKKDLIRYMTSNPAERMQSIDGLIREIKKWYSLTVFVIGCGGVGGYFAWYSAKAEMPVYRFVLIDDDTVERKNVTRQIFRGCDVGKKKVDALGEIINEINPGLEVVKIDKKADEDILREIKSVLDFNPFAFALVATDTLKSKADIYKALNSKRVFVVNNDHNEIEIKNELTDEDFEYWGEDNGYQTDQNFIANLYTAEIFWTKLVRKYIYNIEREIENIVFTEAIVSTNYLKNFKVKLVKGELVAEE